MANYVEEREAFVAQLPANEDFRKVVCQIWRTAKEVYAEQNRVPFHRLPDELRRADRSLGIYGTKSRAVKESLTNESLEMLSITMGKMMRPCWYSHVRYDISESLTKNWEKYDANPSLLYQDMANALDLGLATATSFENTFYRANGDPFRPIETQHYKELSQKIQDLPVAQG